MGQSKVQCRGRCQGPSQLHCPRLAMNFLADHKRAYEHSKAHAKEPIKHLPSNMSLCILKLNRVKCRTDGLYLARGLPLMFVGILKLTKNKTKQKKKPQRWIICSPIAKRGLLRIVDNELSLTPPLFTPFPLPFSSFSSFSLSLFGTLFTQFTT